MDLSSKLLIIIFSFGFCLFPTEQENPFVFITQHNHLIMEAWTPECGEFGSNYERLTIHRHKEGNTLVANYYKSDIKCESPIKKISESINMVLNQSDIELLEVCIDELEEMKIEHQGLITHVGIKNSLYSTDSLIVVSDWPSEQWKSFRKLSTKLKRRKTIANTK